MAMGTFSGGGLGFGLAFTLADRFTGPANAIRGSFNQLETATDRLANKINDSLGKISAGAAMVATGIGILAPLKKAMDVRSEFENYEIQLTTLLKSADRAREVLANIKKDAKDNPIFGTKELMVANTSLIATGEMDPERARSMVNNLATAVAGVGKGNDELSRMSANLMQIATTGKATSMDIKQFGMAGIPIYRMLAESTGLSIDKLKEMDVTLPMLEEAFAKAAGKGGMFEGALERAAAGTAGLKAALEDNVIFTLEAIGKTLEPITKPLLTFLNDILSWVQDFANTPFGKWVVMIAAVTMGLIALTLVIVGVIMVVEALAAVIGTVLLEVLPIILAFVIWIGMFWLLYEAIQSNNPIILAFGAAIMIALGPLGWLAAAVMIVVRALDEFDSYMRAVQESNGLFRETNPVILFFVRLGAIIRAVIEIFQSANNEGFSLSEGLDKALGNLGIKDLVLSIGTWIVRIKAFLRGMKEGFIEAWQAAKKWLGEMWDRLTPVLGISEKWEDFIGRNTSDVKKWGEWGAKAATGIAIVLGVLIALFVVLAVVSILAFLPEILMGILVVGVILIIIWIVMKLIEWYNSLGETGKAIINWLILLFTNLPAFLISLMVAMFEVGVAFVTNLWEGVKSKWAEFKTWLSDSWNEVKNFLGFGDDLKGSVDGTVTTNKNVNFAGLGKQTAGLNAGGGGNFFSNQYNQQSYGGPVTVPVYLDSDKITEKVVDNQNRTNARK